MTEQFTPGPWSVVDHVEVWTNSIRTEPDGRGYPIVECLPMREFAATRGVSRKLLDLDVREANARLIAAAPRMFALLCNIDTMAVGAHAHGEITDLIVAVRGSHSAHR